MKTSGTPNSIARVVSVAAIGLVFMSLGIALAVFGADSTSDTTKPKDTTKSAVVDSVHDTLPGPEAYVPVDTLPEMISEQPPVYPREAKLKNQTGIVWVKALVGTDGNVYRVALAKTSKKQLLDESALAAAYKCRYKPAKKDGKPVACWVTYKVEYKLGG